jgi:HAMP domain-containing protein
MACFPIEHSPQRLVAQVTTETPRRPLARHAEQFVATRPRTRPNRKILGNWHYQLTLARLRPSRLSVNWRGCNGLDNRLEGWRRRFGEHHQRNQTPIPPALCPPALLAPVRGTPMPGRPPRLPLLRLPTASITAIMTAGMGGLKGTLAPFEQTTPTAKTARRSRRLLCRSARIGILKGAQGSCCSRRSSLGGELLLPPRRFYSTGCSGNR